MFLLLLCLAGKTVYLLSIYLEYVAQVAAVHLTPELFSVENDMMTPTFKLKRPQAAKAFNDHIDAMYAALKQQQQ